MAGALRVPEARRTGAFFSPDFLSCLSCAAFALARFFAAFAAASFFAASWLALTRPDSSCVAARTNERRAAKLSPPIASKIWRTASSSPLESSSLAAPSIVDVDFGAMSADSASSSAVSSATSTVRVRFRARAALYAAARDLCSLVSSPCSTTASATVRSLLAVPLRGWPRAPSNCS